MTEIWSASSVEWDEKPKLRLDKGEVPIFGHLRLWAYSCVCYALFYRVSDYLLHETQLPNMDSELHYPLGGEGKT